jgi:hypothetical protein
MSDNPYYSAFKSLAEKEEAHIASIIPRDEDSRFALFLEALRAIDYWTVFQSHARQEQRLPLADFQIMQWGWNKAAAHLFSPLKRPNGVPVHKSTDESRSYAMAFLHQLGRATLMHRTAEMIRFGFMTAETIDDGFIVRKTDLVSSQFLDNLEFSRWEKLEQHINDENQKFYKNWKILNFAELNQVQHHVGNYFGREKVDFKKWQRADIDSLMIPLIHPWDSGSGMMMGYGARPEVDHHFLAKASEQIKEYRDDAGLHPNSNFSDTTGADITAVAIIVTALHLKHIHFALLASKHYPEISIPISLTIWGPMKDLEKSIADFSGMKLSRVEKAVKAITLRPQEAIFLQKHSTPFMPLLINLDNGFVVQPVSSLGRNPLLPVVTLLEWRDPLASIAISKPREAWLRSEIYAMFQGTRFICVEGSIKVRNGEKLITDIDAAVFDLVWGELALIQIKWQDFHTNDIRKLRSKASNLAKELDDWARGITEWISLQGMQGVANSLRIRGAKIKPISNVYLFAVSRDAARTKGFGFTTTQENLAMANWPQFKRVRFDLGPEKRVFHDMHTILREEADKQINPKPMPVQITVSGEVIRFEDLWNTFETDISDS